MRPRRFRTWAKWTCTLAAVLALGGAVASGFIRCFFEIVWRGGTRACLMTERCGLLDLTYLHPQGPLPDYLSHNAAGAELWIGWDWGTDSPSRNHVHSPWHTGVLCRSDRFESTAGTSLLYPVLLTTLPAAFLWYKDRRRSSPHTCPNCNYDRRGLPADSKCPECGTTPARG
jgi:hypothetical protein